MKIILTATFLVTLFVSLAQENPSHWSIGILGSPDVAYRNHRVLDDDPILQDWKKYADETESILPAFTFGLAGRFNAGPHLSIQIGLNYSHRGFVTDSIFVMRSADPNDVDLMKWTHLYRFADLPVGVNYESGSKKFRFLASGGLGMYYMLSGSNLLYSYGDKSTTHGENDMSNNQRLGLYFFAGTGLSWHFSNKMHAQVMPMFRYGLTDISKLEDKSTKVTFWNAGLELGFFYHFQN